MFIVTYLQIVVLCTDSNLVVLIIIIDKNIMATFSVGKDCLCVYNLLISVKIFLIFLYKH